MLVEFRVKNFRSIRDELVLSLVASKDKTLMDTHTVTTGIPAIPSVLKSAAIYGANASGKSNLIKALQYMRRVVVESATLIQPGQSFAVQPYLLDSKSQAAPTEFEITFLLDDVRYQYGLSMTSERIIGEHLLVYKSPKPQLWFERTFDAETDKDVYKYGTNLKGPKNIWESATRANSLFLSMATQLNSEQLKPIFDWFSTQLVIFNETAKLNQRTSIRMLGETNGKNEICGFLSAADISINDIKSETQKVSAKTVSVDLASGKTEVKEEEIEQQKIRFHHVTDNGEAIFDLKDESSGTRNLFFLAGPVLEILNNGHTLIIDELDTSLHTLLVRELVELFHKPSVNKGNAQLIFTTHDTSLLDAEDLFRRDQVWMIEKDRDEASQLASLSEYSPRKGEALERGYLMGRYGGIPFLDHEGLKS